MGFECIECGKIEYSVIVYGGYCKECYEKIIHENPL